MKNSATARNTNIDIAKGLGILLVVFGHNWIVQNKPGELYRIIFSFHMPLFFFLSGIFLAPGKDLFATAVNKADSLLKPYFVVLLPLGLLHMARNGSFSLDYFIGMLYGTGHAILWIPLWFLPNLFLTQMLAVCVLKTSLLKDKRQCQLLFIALLILIGIPLLHLGHNFSPMNLEILPGEKRHLIGLPWSLDIAPLSLAFLLSGYLFADYAKRPGINALPLMAMGCLFALLHGLFNDTLNMDGRLYDSALVSTAEAYTGILILIGLSGLLSRFPSVAHPLAFLGNASLFIFIFHTIVQGRLTGHFQARWPENPYLGAWIGFILGVAVPALMFKLCRRTRWLAPWLLPLRTQPQRA